MTWDLIGHSWAAEMLQQHIVHNRVRHAYLFCGPQGVGRRSLALMFAQALNCLQPVAPGEPCGQCRICRQTAAMQHADLSIVQTLEDSATIKIEQVRELLRSLSLTPYEAHYRIALLLNFDQATTAAQNALLKTLEEAPARTILLLTAADPENLLATIVSRCEVLRLRPAPAAELELALQNRTGIDASQVHELVNLSNGRPGFALRLAGDPETVKEHQHQLNEFVALLRGSRLERFKAAEALSKDKEKLRQILPTWLVFWRDVMLAAAGAAAPLTNASRAEEIRSIANQCGFDQAQRQMQIVEQALEGLDANLNTRLLLDLVLLDAPYL